LLSPFLLSSLSQASPSICYIDPASTTGEITMAVSGYREVELKIYQVKPSYYNDNVFDPSTTLAIGNPNSATKNGKLVHTEVCMRECVIVQFSPSPVVFILFYLFSLSSFSSLLFLPSISRPSLFPAVSLFVPKR
jgi:hypothetical protein